MLDPSNISRSHDPDPKEKSGGESGEQPTQPTDRSDWSCVLEPSLLKPSYSQKQKQPPTQEDYRTKFYELYRREAEEYDREFIKKYDEDLNTTLIFVRVLCPLCI